MWNFIGVVLSSGAVAFGIISLLPVEPILQVGSGACSSCTIIAWMSTCY
jgi:hypothetical protein